jgi:hypothetical protein
MVRGRGKHSSAACSHLVLREVGGLRIGVAGGDLNGADRDPGVQSGRYEAVTEQVRGDVLGDTGPLGEAPHDPGGAVPVESVAGPGGIEAPSDHGRGSSTVSRPPTLLPYVLAPLNINAPSIGASSGIGLQAEST